MKIDDFSSLLPSFYRDRYTSMVSDWLSSGLDAFVLLVGKNKEPYSINHAIGAIRHSARELLKHGPHVYIKRITF